MIEIVTPSPDRTLWEEVVSRIAQTGKDRLWNLPCWIVEDSRHRRRAEVDLMRALDQSALPTENIHTLASLAGRVLSHHPQNQVVTASAASIILAEILGEECPAEYRASADKPGFSKAFWHSLCDAESRGFFPGDSLADAEKPKPPAAFIHLQKRLHQRLESLNRCTPGQFLLSAVKKLQDQAFQFEVSSPLFIGPILSRSPLERAFIGQLIARAKYVVLAPAQDASITAILPQSLSQSLQQNSNRLVLPTSHLLYLRPTTPEDELEAVFSIIARWAAEGTFHYSDIRLVHPLAGEILPQMQSAARRYRVPVKFSLGRELKDFPGVIALRRLMGFYESKWDRTNLLNLLRSRLFSASFLEKSAMIEAVLNRPDPRTKPPLVGWTELAQSVKAPSLGQSFQELHDLDCKPGKQSGADFASWVKQLGRFIRRNQEELDPEFLTEGDQSQEQNAWETLDSVLEDLAHCFPSPQPRRLLIAELEKALEMARSLSPDHRRDAVEIAPDTRDDFLPVRVVVYLGLTSRVPPPDRHDPFSSGQTPISYEEKLRLFRQIIANASDTLLLSCPRFDDDGNELSPSPFLGILSDLNSDTAQNGSEELLLQAVSWKPHDMLSGFFTSGTVDPDRFKQIPPSLFYKGGKKEFHIIRKAPLALLAKESHFWSPSKLNDAIQCKYKHFGARILKLEPRRDALVEIATPLLLGNIAHEVLQDYIIHILEGNSYDLSNRTQDMFGRLTSYLEPHPELDRAREVLVRCLTQIAPQLVRLAPGFTPHRDRLEIGFGGGDKKGKTHPPLVLESGTQKILVQGAIDRLDCDADNRVLVIEYKYKKSENENKNDFFAEVLSGQQPQLPLYWLVARDLLGMTPVALLQIYLRSKVIRILKIPGGPEFPEEEREIQVESVTPGEVQRMLENTIALLKEKALALASGEVTAFPEDFTQCGPAACEYADLCRYREAR